MNTKKFALLSVMPYLVIIIKYLFQKILGKMLMQTIDKISNKQCVIV